MRREGGKVFVRGTTSDNGPVKQVLVNGQEARPLRPNLAEWEITLSDPHTEGLQLSAHAEDEAGNVERQPHVMRAQGP
jgi:hypothetical protein